MDLRNTEQSKRRIMLIRFSEEYSNNKNSVINPLHKDLTVQEVIVQSSEKNLYGRSVRLDALCTLGSGKKARNEGMQQGMLKGMRSLVNSGIISVQIENPPWYKGTKKDDGFSVISHNPYNSGECHCSFGDALRYSYLCFLRSGRSMESAFLLHVPEHGDGENGENAPYEEHAAKTKLRDQHPKNQ